MNIFDLVNRTKTYLAGDWTGDNDIITELHKWNKDESLSLHFVDVHDLTTSSDRSLNCSIKRSLRQRMNITKTFVLIVGEKTKSLRSGACYECSYYRRQFNGIPYCSRSYNNTIDKRSFVEFECEMAYNDYMQGKLKRIVVIYNGLTKVDKEKCPEILRNIGKHLPSDVYKDCKLYWNYENIKNAICD